MPARTALAAMLLPPVHFENVVALVSGDTEILHRAQMAFEAEVSLSASALVILGDLAALAGAALAIFRGRDHGGRRGAERPRYRVELLRTLAPRARREGSRCGCRFLES